MMRASPAADAVAATGLLWWVTDQLPYPPRNGITLPSYHHAVALGRKAALRLVLLHAADQPPAADQLAQNVSIFGPVVLIPLRRQGAGRRFAAELRGREMFQHGYVLADAASRLDVSPKDCMVVTPMSAVAKLHACAVDGLLAAQRRLALVNDCTAGEYRYRLQSCGLNARAAVKGVVDLLRSAQIGRIERALLADYDHVLLQTPRDIEVFKALVGAPVAERARCVPNGVHPSLLSLQTSGAKRFVFLAELSGEHGALAHWLVSEVWPHVQAGEWELLIVGKGASPALKAKFAQAPAVQHLEFVDKIESVYAQASVALSPVFKGFGLINKTIEPMAAGLPVVGGRAAFNGIAGFADGVHGIACDRASPQLFAQAMQRLMNDAARRARIGDAARQLVRCQFDWARSSAAIAKLLALGDQAVTVEPETPA
jgi:hypothetical protein